MGFEALALAFLFSPHKAYAALTDMAAARDSLPQEGPWR